MCIGSEGGGRGGSGTEGVTATGPQPATPMVAASTQRPAHRGGGKEMNRDKDMECFGRLHSKKAAIERRERSAGRPENGPRTGNEAL